MRIRDDKLNFISILLNYIPGMQKEKMKPIKKGSPTSFQVREPLCKIKKQHDPKFGFHNSQVTSL